MNFVYYTYFYFRHNETSKEINIHINRGKTDFNSLKILVVSHI